jgi:ketosteroid isomerase-like protein
MRVLRFAPVPALLLAACSPSPDMNREREALLAADRAFDSTVAAVGLEGWVSFFSDSGRQIDNYGDFVFGHVAIRDHMRGLLTDSTRSLRWAPDRAEVSGDGSLGYTWGRWTMLRRGTAPAEELARGRYLTVWRKQTNGSWKAEADVGTGVEKRRGG